MATYEVAYSTYNTAKLNEQMLYGQGRLGYRDRDQLIYTSQFALPAQGDIYNNTLGEKRYEMTNHLGNVIAVLSDRKMATTGGTPSTYQAVIWMKSDYYPFGMQMPAKSDSNGITINGSWHTDEYRFGYNGMEKDHEVKGDGNSYTTEFRQYDPRLGRWMSLDPLMMQFPWMSPYVAFDNNPVVYTDPYGLEATGGGNPAIFNTGEESDPGLSQQMDPVPIPSFEKLAHYTYSFDEEKWNVYNDWRLKNVPAFKTKMDQVAIYGESIAELFKDRRGYYEYVGEKDLYFQEDTPSKEPNTEEGGNLQTLNLNMMFKTLKDHLLKVSLALYVYQPSDNIGGEEPMYTKNELKKISMAKLANYYTNCFADALGLIGHVQELKFNVALADDYVKIDNIEDARIGDIFYPSSLEGGIGHAMVLINIKENGEKSIEQILN